MDTLCKQAHELLMTRQRAYGDMVDSWHEVALAVTERTGLCLSAEETLWVLIEMKLNRDRHSPENPDHLRDAIGYLGILGRVRAANGSACALPVPKTVREEFEDLRRSDLP